MAEVPKIDTSAVFREAETMADIRVGEGKFGPVWTEKNVAEIYAKLMAAFNEQPQGELSDSFQAHPLLDSPQLDGIADDLINLAIQDPEKARKLANELNLQHQKRLEQQKQMAHTPRMTPY